MSFRAKSGWMNGAITALVIVAGFSTASAQSSYDSYSSTPLADRAANYIEFRTDIQVIDATPIDNASVSREAHNRLASHTAENLSAGWIAYAALVAADTPEFAQSIQAATATAEGRAAFIEQLRADPRSVRNLPGTMQAIDAVRRVAASDAAHINNLGDRFTQEAYKMQNKGWARKKLSTDGMSRVYEADSYGYSRAWMAAPELPVTITEGVKQPGLDQGDYMWKPDWSSYDSSGNANPRAATVMDRILILAARYGVGEITGPIVNGYAKSKTSRRCFNTARMNLSQCIAASRSPTEEVFCLGRHGLSENGSCIGWLGGMN